MKAYLGFLLAPYVKGGADGSGRLAQPTNFGLLVNIRQRAERNHMNVIIYWLLVIRCLLVFIKCFSQGHCFRMLVTGLSPEIHVCEIQCLSLGGINLIDICCEICLCAILGR